MANNGWMSNNRNVFSRRTLLRGAGAALALPAFPALLRADNAPNTQSNPYRVVVDWAHLPQGMTWGVLGDTAEPSNDSGQVVAIDIDQHGDIYMLHRHDPDILKFSPEGKLLKSWGENTFAMAHGLTVDRFGFIWTADNGVKDGRGCQVLKWDSDGKLLMSLGKKGVAAESAKGETFIGPTSVAVAANGDIWVTDGHGRAKPGLTHRLLRFSKDGKFINAVGRTGSGPGELHDPHAIAMDSQGRLFVADRQNKRIEVFDQEGGFIASWPQFGSAEIVYVAPKDDTIYVTDSNSGQRTPDVPYNNPPFKKGTRVGSAKDGSVKYFIPVAEGAYGGVALAADSKGTVYVADAAAAATDGSGFAKMNKKYIKR
jgi:6-bladed beta-propeller